MRPLLAPLLCLLVVVAACGGDDDTDAATTTSAPSATAPEVTEGGGSDGEGGGDDGAETTTSPESTVPTDAPAGDAPAGGGDEGLGDALLVADLVPETEVPGPGDAGADGRFEGELVDGVLCIDMVVGGLSEPVSAAHVHEGAAGRAGPVLVPLPPPTTADGGEVRWTDACTEVDDEVIEALAAAPDRHYVNVHTAAFPDGAVRGQLAVTSIFDRTLG